MKEQGDIDDSVAGRTDRTKFVGEDRKTKSYGNVFSIPACLVGPLVRLKMRVSYVTWSLH